MLGGPADLAVMQLGGLKGELGLVTGGQCLCDPTGGNGVGTGTGAAGGTCAAGADATGAAEAVAGVAGMARKGWIVTGWVGGAAS